MDGTKPTGRKVDDLWTIIESHTHASKPTEPTTVARGAIRESVAIVSDKHLRLDVEARQTR